MLGGARPAFRAGRLRTPHSVSFLHPGAFRILQGKLQFTRKRIDGRTAALPRSLGLESQITDAASPRRDHASDCAEVGAIRVVLIEATNDVGSDAYEGPQRGRRLDAVLGAVPGGAKDHRDLLEIVHEELPGVVTEIGRLARAAERIAGKQLLELLGKRSLGHSTVTDAQQLDLSVKR